MDLEQLNIPQFDNLRHPEVLKPAILDARRSAALGIWLVLTPVFFLACVTMKYWIGWNLGLIRNFEQFWTALDQDRLGFWLQPLVLFVAPAAAVVLNLLAVLHVQFDRTRKELNINAKLRWYNLLLVAIGLSILAVFTLYMIGEYVHHASTGR